MADDDGDMTNPPLKPASIARVVELARQHCRPDHWGEWLRIPLQLAAFDGDQELAEELELAGAIGDPIDAAIQGGQLEFVDCRLETAVEAGYLQLAVKRGHEAIVSLLLARGADPAAMDCDCDGFTPLQFAAKAGHAGIVGLLLDAGAPVHPRVRKEEWKDGYPDALDLAAVEGHVDVITEITQRERSSINSVSLTNWTSLHFAAKHSQLGAIDALVEAGADVDARNDGQSETPLHIAAGSPESEATLLSLLRHGASVHSTASISATAGGCYLSYLTPLCNAVEANNRVAVDTLLSAGADANAPLLVASARSYSREMIAYLLERGADVNVRDSRGNTPLHLAAKTRLKPHVNTLLEAGADETALNEKGKTPLDEVPCGRWSRRLSGGTWCRLKSPAEEIRALLVNAPRDRADRAWSRRGFFVLCRAFPERVRLQVVPSQDVRIQGSCSTTSSASDDPSISRANTKRVATAEERGGVEGRMAGEHAQEGTTAFRAAMSRLMVLEADVIFQKIVEFV